MNAKIITIGDEILIGQITDTNSVYIANCLTNTGIKVEEMMSIPDSPERLKKILDADCGRFGLLVFTGGLGPTKDDLTKNAVTEWFDDIQTENKDALKAITAFFASRGMGVTPVNRQQAMLPTKCTPLPNRVGTAPGMWFEKSGSVIVFLPGVPFEMKGLMDEQVIPRLKKIARIPQIIHRTIMTQGIPESVLSDMLEEWEASLPEGIKLAYLPRPGIVRLRLTAKDLDPEKAEQLLESEITKLLKIIPHNIFSFNDISLEKALGDLLREKKLTICTAESCTGGAIAGSLTSVPGSSDYFLGSVVSYSNKVKAEILHVPENLLKDFGAVSKEVVEAMAVNSRKLLNSDLSVAVSGIAGPSGGSPEKPVGTTWIAVACEEGNYSRKFLFGDNRERNIERARLSALEMVRELIEGFLP